MPGVMLDALSGRQKFGLVFDPPVGERPTIEVPAEAVSGGPTLITI